MLTVRALARVWYELFNRHAEDLYPGRYTFPACLELAEVAVEILRRKEEKGSTIVAHNYLYPEFHEIADKVGDSLGLSFYVRDQKASRVDFESVFFMGATAKIITGDATRVFVPDRPETLGCSLVFGTDYRWIEDWKRQNPDGILVTYVNSDAYTKSISDYISTSRNTHRVILHAILNHPGKKILVLPDKFLGYVMKIKALEEAKQLGVEVSPDLIEVYEHKKGEWNACCYVHEMIAWDAPLVEYLRRPDAELMIHPECGCASSCMAKLQRGELSYASKIYFLSTEGMIEQAKRSPAKVMVVATEKGLIYRLRKEVPEKQFVPVSLQAECRYMKANLLEKLLASLQHDRLEIVFCDDCCDPKRPFMDERVIHIQRSVAAKAKIAIDRMLEIQ
jgi:quinolinate synthase